jgi:hypothetical protein
MALFLIKARLANLGFKDEYTSGRHSYQPIWRGRQDRRRCNLLGNRRRTVQSKLGSPTTFSGLASYGDDAPAGYLPPMISLMFRWFAPKRALDVNVDKIERGTNV